MTLLTDPARATPGAYAADPLNADEIDALPNADRVWATILAMRAEHEEVSEDYEAQLERAGHVT